MKEELIIKAYELLEEKRAFNRLNIEEQQRVIEVFGDKTEYERMLSLSDIAMEEDEIIAPSMSAESLLFKEFAQKHEAKKSKSSGAFSLSKLFSSKTIRIAVPSLVVLIGLTFFLNREINEDLVVAESSKTETIQEQPTFAETEKTKEKPTFFEDEQFENGSSDQLQKDNALSGDADITKGLAIDNKEVLEIVLDDFEEETEEDISFDNVGLSNSTEPNVLDGFVTNNYSSGTAVEQAYRPAADHSNMSFTWSDSTVTSIGTFTVQDANGKADADKALESEAVPAPSMDDYIIDDTYGNATISNVEMDEVQAISVEREGSSNKDISVSSNATNDKNLFEFLYTTY